ncbi:reverse transcriptase domain-containing protein [Tanacetum coccineum]
MVQWTTEADEAFRRMKEILEALPVVTAPVNGETLIVYLAASKESINAVLMAERVKKQVHVYFVSRTLHGAEIEYPELEKLILALVYATRKLRRYFQAHPIQKNSEIKDGKAKRKEPEPENAWKLFTDGASSSNGSGAGLMLVNPEGKEYTYTLRFEFETTNNEAEYEALLAGLRIVKEMKIQELIIFVVSQLVANQVNGLFEARQPVIKQYLEKEKELLPSFPTRYYNINIIKRDQNKNAYAHRALIKLHDDPQKAKKLRIKAPLYKLMNGTLYRISYLSPWLRCVGAAQAKNIIQEDAKELIQNCETCQIHSLVPRKLKQEMTSIMSAWPFSQWGIDIVGPLPMAPRGARFLVVAIDYFTKWVEAKQLISTTRKHMERFMWEYIVCRILQAYTSVYHPQANGQVEVTNREIVKGMERRLGKTHQGWVYELPQVLWAHRTTLKSSNRETPFSLVYGLKAVILIEISVETKRI